MAEVRHWVLPEQELKIPFTKSNGGAQSPASLSVALVLVALVPAVCVLWFMTVAMRALPKGTQACRKGADSVTCVHDDGDHF